ncbi:MAG: metal-dependent hydrolase [Methanothermobacter sp.]|nr:metal-dependent hydrolase [Methanothermobacter sp.]
MKWYTHAFFAIVMGAILGYLMNTEFTILFLIITVISSLLIDFAEKAIFDNHKRQLHNMFMLVPCILIYLFYDMTIGTALTAGILSHILLDCLTPVGCPLFWPIYQGKYNVEWKHKNSKAREKRVFSSVVLLALLTILVLLPQGPFMSAISTWTSNSTNRNKTNDTRIELRLNINNPTKDIWIHPLPNGSIFIDIADEGQGNVINYYYSYPRYYNPPNCTKSSEEGANQAEEGVGW